MPADKVAPDLSPRDRAANLAVSLDRLDNTVQYSWLIEIARQTFHRFPARPDRGRREPSTSCTIGPTVRGRRPGLGPPAVWGAVGSRGGFLDQRVRRPARGLGPIEVRPLPADRRPGAQAALAGDGRAAAAGDERRRSRLRQPRGSPLGALCSIISSATGPRRAPSACRPTSAPPPSDAQESRSRSDPESPAPDGLAARRARRDPPIGLLDARGILFGIPFAVRSDDRSDPQRLSDRSLRRSRPVRSAGELARLRRPFQRIPARDFSDFDPCSRRGGRARGVRLDLSQRRSHGALVVLERAGVHRGRFLQGQTLQAVPKTVKLVGYYSDAYTLEFVLPKFNMYRRLLAETLAEEGMVAGRDGRPTEALELGAVGFWLGKPQGRIFGFESCRPRVAASRAT